VVEAMLARLEATGVVARTGDDVAITDLGRALALLFDWDDDDDFGDDDEDDFEFDVDLDVEVDLVDADAQFLLAICADLDVEEAEEALADWCGAREPEEAAGELARAVEEDPELFTLALDAFSLLGPAAVGAVRRLQTQPGLRPLATFWLVKHGLEGPQALSEEDHTAMLVDMLAMLASSGDDEVVDGLEGLGPVGEQLRVVELLSGADHDKASLMLEVIGRAHPRKAVATAARRAAVRRR